MDKRSALFALSIVLSSSLLFSCSVESNQVPEEATQSTSKTLDEQNRVTAMIPSSGASVITTGQDGTVFALIFPPGAVASDTQVSVAPVISIEGTPFDVNIVAALDLTPDGLQLDIPAQLIIAPSGALAVDQLALGMHMASTGEDLDLWPAQVDANGYDVEITHFSVGGLVQMTEEEWYPYVLEQILRKFYGPFGLVERMTSATSCSDYRFHIFEQLAADITKVVSDVGGEQPEFVLDPPRQCTGYLGDTPQFCGSVFELDDAARQNLQEAFEYFTRDATQRCSSGDSAQEAEAALCIERAVFWEDRFPEVELSLLCDIKAQCGIATLYVEPAVLDLAVGESEQIAAIARDQAGVELVDRRMQWTESDADVAKLSAFAVSNPHVTGVSPGTALPGVFDEITAKTLCPTFSRDVATVKVWNSFVTDVESVTVPEGGTTYFQVKLASPPDVGVRANVSVVSGDSDITIASGEVLDFTENDWDTFQTVVLFAFEDDGDSASGTATLQIEDSLELQSNQRYAAKEIVATEFDNDGPSMTISPEVMCVESTGTLSVNGNQFVDLNAISWSSSDATVATVNDQGGVIATGEGPARISASMTVDGEVVASAFSTVFVKDYCMEIESPSSCVEVADTAAFEPVDNPLLIKAKGVPGDPNVSVGWNSSDNQVATVSPLQGGLPADGLLTGVGSGQVEISVFANSEITNVRSKPIPFTVVTLPTDYTPAWLTVPADLGKVAVLTEDRRIFSESQLEAIVLEAETRCDVELPEVVAGNGYTDLNQRGQILGYYRQNFGAGNVVGFVFDTETCALDTIDLPVDLPVNSQGGTPGPVTKATYPQAINENGRIVGDVFWQVLSYDSYGDLDGYNLYTGFVYDLNTELHQYPMLPFGYDPYTGVDIDDSGFTDINNNGIALGWWGADFLYDTNNPGSNAVSISPAENAAALNDSERVVGLNWVYSNGEVYLPPLVSSDGSPLLNYKFWDIINSDDILARAWNLPEPNTEKYFVTYVCPFSVEDDIAAEWFEDKALLEGYEDLEISCDGLDNDLNGYIDFPLVSQLTSKQAGVCENHLKSCNGARGWINYYLDIPTYEFPEVSCDGLDNDCDGIPDEHCP